MPSCHQLGNIIHSAQKMYWEKGLQQGNPCHEVSVRNVAAHVHGHPLLDTSEYFLILFIFMISNVLCAHTHRKKCCRYFNYLMLTNTFQNSSLSKYTGNIFAAIAKRKVTPLKLHA